MKKVIAICEIIFILCMALTCAPAGVENIHKEYSEVAENGSLSAFRLPASLQIIENEAFEGTLIAHVELPNTLKSIGDRAFANIQTLLSVQISATTETIANTAFTGSHAVTIIGAPNSFARIFARENGLAFRSKIVMLAESGRIQIIADEDACQNRTDAIDGTKEVNTSTQWRPVEELKAEQFDQYIANHIIGRAPPACV